MDPTEASLRLIGAFYTFAGYAATRAALTSYLFDRAIAAISGKRPSARESARTGWLLAGANIVFAGGLALTFLLDAAAYLFMASAAGQAAYLALLAPRYFDVEDPPDPKGRRQTTNAFVLYAVATAYVLWALYTGRLLAPSEFSWLVLTVAVGMVVGHVGYTIWMLADPLSRVAECSPSPGGTACNEPAQPPSQSRRVKLMADYGSHPLWALDDGLYGDIPPEDLGLSEALTRDLNRWAQDYTASLDPDDPATSRWTQEEYREHAVRARPLAERLKRERPDLTVYVPGSAGEIVEVVGADD